MHRNSLLTACLLVVPLTAASLPQPGTETMHSIAHVKSGHEEEYAKLTAQAWSTYQRLGLVLDTPHIVLRGKDLNGRTYFVEIFTWKSHDIPDHAPADVKAIWQQLEAACEPRDGRPGIDFEEVTAVQLN